MQTQPEVTDALQELKQEIKNLRTELNRLESSILKERAKTVEDALTQNRILKYAAQLQDEFDEDLPKILDTQCKNYDKCLERFKTLANENLEIIRDLKINEAITDIDTKIDNMEQVIQKTQGTTCETCHKDFQKKLHREKRAFQTITLVQKTPEKDQAELNIDRLVEGVLEPLANPARLKILISTFEGKKSFSKIGQITSLKGGHLLFHIKKLVDAGLVAQEDNKGDYIITQKGVEVAKKIFILQT